MSTILRSWRLANGIVVEVEDDTVNYYADYHNIKLTLIGKVPVKQEYIKSLADNPLYSTVAEMLSPVVEYRREIIRAGVPGRDLIVTKTHLVDRFEENALPYFKRGDFPERFVQKNFRETEEALLKKNRPPLYNEGT
jgi:hypothetical protein